MKSKCAQFYMSSFERMDRFSHVNYLFQMSNQDFISNKDRKPEFNSNNVRILLYENLLFLW
jgi:hypothetical protein